MDMPRPTGGSPSRTFMSRPGLRVAKWNNRIIPRMFGSGDMVFQRHDATNCGRISGMTCGDQAKGIRVGQMLVRIMQSAQLISEHVGYTEHVFNHHAHTNAISRAMIASWSVRHLKWCTMVNIVTLSPRTVMLERLSFTCSNQTLNAVKHSRTCCPLGEPRGIWKICSSSAVFLGRKMSKSHH